MLSRAMSPKDVSAVLLAAALTPLLLIYLSLAFALAVMMTCLILPRLLLAQKLYWCCPFIPHIWQAQGPVKGNCLRLAFETTYSINVLRRLLTLPIRSHLPDFYIVGFPKAGTTSLANCLKLHPAISGMDGLPWHEALSKESHYFNGVFGPAHASSAVLYSSFFPTVLCRWWAEHVRGVKKWLCFDACPVTACLPYTARRMAAITPNAKLIFMLRDPVKSMFSAETMLVNMGMLLQWDLTKPPAFQGAHLQEQEDEAELWKDLNDLQPDDSLPQNMPHLFYSRLQILLKSSQYSDRISPFLQEFPISNMMFIDFQDFTQNTESVVRQVCSFVGADPVLYHFKPPPAGMKTDYQMRALDPGMKAYLSSYFQRSNNELCALLQRKFNWSGAECVV